MKLSEAIRAGAKLRPQAIGHYMTNGCSCAMGAAYEAVGCMDDHGELDGMDEKWDRTWSVMAGRPIDCPADGCKCGLGNLHATITHLNDDHRWTREQIADWVEQVESGKAVAS